MGYYVYVLESAYDGTHYKGQARNLEIRLKEHNRGKVKSTKGHRPWKLIYYEEFTTRKEAIVRERYFKTVAGRRYLKKSITGSLFITSFVPGS